MTGRIEKYHATRFAMVVWVRNLDAISADVLRDTASLAGCDFSCANRVEKGSLAMVDVSHHRHDWRARQFHVISVGGDQFFKFLFRHHFFKRNEGDVVT